MRFLLIALTLTACSCSADPIMPDAQARLQLIAADYVKARMEEEDHCPPAPKCGEVRRAGYDAEAAYVIADRERTAKAIAEARVQIGKYKTAADLL